MMKDLRWPEWDAGTYYCTWYAGFTPKGAVRNNFYGGVRTRGPKGPTGMFWTFWGDIKGVSSGKQFSGGSGYGAEGSAGGFNGRPDFLRPNAWYRFVVRVYPPKEKDKAGKTAYVGWWIKDVEKGIWYHHSTVELLGPATGLAGNGGFVEAMAGGNVRRVLERRLGYGRLANGEWYKADGIRTSSPKCVKIIEKASATGFRNVEEENANYIYGRRFDTPVPARSARLTVVDIFDQEKSVILPVRAIEATDPAAHKGNKSVIPGLLYALHEAPGNAKWTSLADFPKTEPARKGLVATLDHSVRHHPTRGV